MRISKLYYWLILILAVNVPGVMSFDQTGLTHNEGLFNFQAIARILLAGAIAVLVVFVGLSDRRSNFFRVLTSKSRLAFTLLYILFAASCALCHGMGIAVAVFRIFEWFLLWYIIEAWANHIPVEQRAAMVSRVFYSACMITFAIVAIGIMVAPRLAFASLATDSAAFEFRLGGSLIHPNRLGVMAGIAFWYFVLFKRGFRRAALASVCVVILILTYSRGAFMGLLVTGPAFVVFGTMRQKLRAVAGCAVAVSLAIIFEQKIWAFLERGQGVDNVTSASDRMGVWTTAIPLFFKRPLTGYGYISGVKESLAGATTTSWWIPPHAHNDILQAALTAGVLAAVLLVIIFIQVAKRISYLPKSPIRTFFIVTFIQITVFAMQGPLVSYELSVLGAMFLMLYACLPARAARRVPPASRVPAVTTVWDTPYAEKSVAQ